MKKSIPTISIPDDVKGLIFDCDGTLVDSMRQHMKAWELAFTHFDQPYREDFLNSYRGFEEKEIVDFYNQTFATNLDSARVVDGEAGLEGADKAGMAAIDVRDITGE